MTSLEWSHAATDIPTAGRTFTREASETERAAIAAELGILSCTRLTAAYTIRPLGKGHYRLEGPCTADVTQACVATLAPVEISLTLALDIEFAPVAPAIPDGEEVEVLDLPEVEAIENGRLPVGRVVFETLAAGLDPFPRAPGAAFSWHDPRGGSEKPNPFAALAKLKPRDRSSEEP